MIKHVHPRSSAWATCYRCIAVSENIITPIREVTIADITTSWLSRVFLDKVVEGVKQGFFAALLKRDDGNVAKQSKQKSSLHRDRNLHGLSLEGVPSVMRNYRVLDFRVLL